MSDNRFEQGAPRLGAWAAFAAAFSFIEASTVFYLRLLLQMPQQLDYAEIMAARGLPMSPYAFTRLLYRGHVLAVEVAREVATLLLLFAAARAAGRTWRERWSLVGFCFALWDLSYYLFLKLETGFPRSLTATDVYFLVPIPWRGPVWFPLLIVMPAILALSAWGLRGGSTAPSPGPDPGLSEERTTG